MECGVATKEGAHGGGPRESVSTTTRSEIFQRTILSYPCSAKNIK